MMKVYDLLFENLMNKINEIKEVQNDKFYTINSASKYKGKIKAIYGLLGKNGSGKTTILKKMFDERRKDPRVFNLFYSPSLKKIVQNENLTTNLNYLLLNNGSFIEGQRINNKSQELENSNIRDLAILEYLNSSGVDKNFFFEELIIDIHVQHISTEIFMGKANSNFADFQLSIYKATKGDAFFRLCILHECRKFKLYYSNKIPTYVLKSAKLLYEKFQPLINQRFFSQQNFIVKNGLVLANLFKFELNDQSINPIQISFKAFKDKESHEKSVDEVFENLNKKVISDYNFEDDYLEPYLFSTGEEIKAYFWGAILHALKETILADKFSKIIIYLDEIDMGLHPEWQKKTIYELVLNINVLTERIQKQVFKDLNLSNFDNLSIDIFVASHSPFIASDVPLQNIIFLDNKDGKVTVNDSVSLDNTFGANIHSLLADGFFLSNGLIGDFAKNKIQDVINWLNNPDFDNNKINEIRNIIGIIGEPIIKNKLIEMLNEKLGIDGELDKINAQIEYWNQLKQELTKNNKNA